MGSIQLILSAVAAASGLAAAWSTRRALALSRESAALARETADNVLERNKMVRAALDNHGGRLAKLEAARDAVHAPGEN